MGRREEPLDRDGPLYEFAAALRAVRAAAGNPPYRELSRRVRYSTSALSAAASGQRLPSLEVTLAYVKACGADPDPDPWRERRSRAAAALRQTNPGLIPPSEPEQPDQPEQPEPDQPESETRDAADGPSASPRTEAPRSPRH